jgi:hypothetical protein
MYRDKTVEQQSYLVGVDPVISQRFQKNNSTMRPAGGQVQMDMHLIHIPASEAVDRIFSHPKDKLDDHKTELQRQRYAYLMHGQKSMRPKSIRVNQPMNFNATFLNVIGSPGNAG